MFPMELIEQEFSPQPEIDIPGEVLDIYRLWRATPLYRARRLEKALDTPAHIYYKYEGTSPAGSHKPNTAVPQAYYNKHAGIRRLATETGAGQWGSALSLACQMFGHGMHRLHGAGQLRAEALPPHDDAHLGRGGLRQPERAHQRRAARCWRRRRIRRAAWASPSAKRWRTPPPTPTPTTRWAAC